MIKEVKTRQSTLREYPEFEDIIRYFDSLVPRYNRVCRTKQLRLINWIEGKKER